MILTVAAFVQLAASCGPSVHVDTLASVAQTESRLDALAIHDNATGQTYHPATLKEAVKIASDLVTVRRHSTDLGLMQVNSANLPALGMSVADAFDACKSVSAGARILVAGYQPPVAGRNAQMAILRDLSRYNTGRPDRGFTNGYVQRVQLAAKQIVPAIRVGSAALAGPEEGEAVAAPPPPPPWDVYGQARYLHERGSLIFGSSAPQASAPIGPAPAQPVQLQVAAAPNTGGER